MLAAADPQAWWQSAAIFAPLIVLAGAMVTLAVNGARARRDRRRDLYADAMAAVTAYWEFPYVVRRRRQDEPAAERVRISELLRDVQERMARSDAWIRTENARVAKAYVNLVAVTRQVMGPQIAEGWNEPAITDDSAMNIGTVHRGGLGEAEGQYLQAVRDSLSLWPAWALRAVRRTQR